MCGTPQRSRTTRTLSRSPPQGIATRPSSCDSDSRVRLVPFDAEAYGDGTGSNTHLAAALFEEVTGVRLVHVPYKGSAPAVADLMGGQVAMFFDTAASSTQPIRSVTIGRSMLLKGSPGVIKAH